MLMKRKKFDSLIRIAILTVIILICSKGIAVAVHAEENRVKVVGLGAYYIGAAVPVGEKYDKSELVVMAYLNTGAQRKLDQTEYTASTEIIYKDGLNTIIIMYGDLTTKAYIYGKTLTELKLSPMRYEFGVGNMPDSKDLTVTAIYSDGSIKFLQDGYKLYPEVLDKPGKQEIYVVYEGMIAKCNVVAREWSAVQAINVTWTGSEILTDTPLNKSDFSVMAAYSDLAPERVTTYTMSPESFTDSGKQQLTITYGGVSKTIDVYVTERYVVELRAEYTGGKVLVGNNIRKDCLHVYIKYADGEEIETKDYSLHNKKIKYLGDNTITVYYGKNFSTSVIIEGAETIKSDFRRISKGTASNGNVEVLVETSIPSYLKKNCTKIGSLKNKSVKKAYRKLGLEKGSYIAFDYGFVNNNDELELPLNVRITIPEGFDIDHTYLYYCPNKKSVLGRVSKEIIDSRTFETRLFKAGTYMLVYSEELNEEE